MSSDEADFSPAMAVAREELVRAVGGLAESQHTGLESDVYATRTKGVVVKFFRVRGLGATRAGAFDPTVRSSDQGGLDGMTPREALSVTLRTIKAHKALGPRGVAPLLWRGVDETKMVKAAAVAMAHHEPLAERPDASWLVRRVIEALLEARNLTSVSTNACRGMRAAAAGTPLRAAGMLAITSPNAPVCAALGSGRTCF
jgi:hypothetical protein